MKVFLAAKLHRLRVTEANVNYAGSVDVDEEIRTAAGIEPYERVQLTNFTSGRTWTTYIVPAAAGSRKFCLNGGAARFGVPGDIVAVLTYRLAEKFQPARVVVLNEHNGIERIRVYGAEQAGEEALADDNALAPPGAANVSPAATGASPVHTP